MKTNISKWIAAVMVCAVAVVMVSCCKDDDALIVLEETSKSIELFHGEDVQVKLKSGNNIKWSSNNTWVAWVNDSGKVVGNHIGQTTIVAKNETNVENINVTVKPKYTLFDEPILSWGTSKANLMNSEGHRLISIVEDQKDVAYDYSSEKYIITTAYDFEEERLSTSILIVTKSNKESFSDEDLSELIDYMLERYQIVTFNDSYLSGMGVVFVNAYDMKSVTQAIRFLPIGNSLVIVYHPVKDESDLYYGVNIDINVELIESERGRWIEFEPTNQSRKKAQVNKPIDADIEICTNKSISASSIMPFLTRK